MAKECLQCGKCCKTLSFYINPMESIVAFYKSRGCDVRQNVVHIPSVCSQLDSLTNKCKIYKDRPAVCAYYGSVTTKGYYIPEGCGYGDEEKPKEPGRSDGTSGTEEKGTEGDNRE